MEDVQQEILQGIIVCLYKRGHSNFFCSALSRKLLVLVWFSYVDDTDLFQTGATPIEVLVSMQEFINSFGSLM